jgi:hypothetical protein
MIDWIAEELKLLRGFWPDLEFIPDGNWVLRRDYSLPSGWNKEIVDLAIRIPAGFPGEQPYGFWVAGGLVLESAAPISNYAFPSETIPGSDESWGKFSWSPEAWTPGAEPGQGMGMIHFAQSVWRRLLELN